MPSPNVPHELRDRPFTTAMAAAAGVSRHQLRGTAWRHVFREVWVAVDVELTRELRFAAVRLILPTHAVVCGLTAAWLHGVDVRRREDLDVHVGFAKGQRRRSREGLIVCQETVAADDVCRLAGVSLTTPLRTAFDCARWQQGATRVVVLDALAHSGQVTVTELELYMSGKRRLRNLRRARALLSVIEPLSESPMETRLRLVLVEGGLPIPVAQYEVRDAQSRFVARLDLAYPELLIGVEYDGALHWEQRRDDDRRRDRLRALGWEVLVYSSEDVYGAPGLIVAQVAAVMRRRGRDQQIPR